MVYRCQFWPQSTPESPQEYRSPHFTVHCDPCNPSLASLEDISLAQMYRANLNSTIFFLLCFVIIYSLNETYISLFQSFPILFFSVSFFSWILLSLIFLCLSLHIHYFLFLFLPLSLSVFYFLSVFYLTYLTFFNYPLSVFYLPSTVCLSSIPLTLLFIFPDMFYYQYYYPPDLFCVLYLSISCLPFLFIFLLYFPVSFFFWTLFFSLPPLIVLVFNYCNMSLLFIFSINLCYLFPFSLAIFFAKCRAQ